MLALSTAHADHAEQAAGRAEGETYAAMLRLLAASLVAQESKQ
jgi:hypothetical protein